MSEDKNEDTMPTTTESDLERLLGEVVNTMETMIEHNEDALNRYHVEHTPREPGRPYIPRLSLKRVTTVDSMNDYRGQHKCVHQTGE